MRRIYYFVAMASFAVVGACAAPARAADVHIDVNIVPPSFVFEAPPRLVVVPGAPRVHYAPDVSVNFFAYGGRYYTHDRGRWFSAGDTHGPWTYVESHHVPQDVLTVPTRYYHVTPRSIGGAHRYGKGHHGHGKKHWKQKRGKHQDGKHHRH